MRFFLFLAAILTSFALGVFVVKMEISKGERPSLDPIYNVPMAITDYFKPKQDVYIVNFFSSWCKACRSEKMELNEIRKKTSVKMYGIVVNDFKENIYEMLGGSLKPYEKVAMDFPIDKLIEMRIDRIPRILIIYKGDVVFDYEGEINKRVMNKRILPIIEEIKERLKD